MLRSRLIPLRSHICLTHFYSQNERIFYQGVIEHLGRPPQLVVSPYFELRKTENARRENAILLVGRREVADIEVIRSADGESTE